MRGVSVVGIRLRQAHERLGISQKQLGITAGLDPSVASPRINQYETGKHVPDIQTARNLAEVLGVPAPYLYADEDLLAACILPYGRVRLVVRKRITRNIIGSSTA